MEPTGEESFGREEKDQPDTVSLLSVCNCIRKHEGMNTYHIQTGSVSDWHLGGAHSLDMMDNYITRGMANQEPPGLDVLSLVHTIP